jgi:hypothetical protein
MPVLLCSLGSIIQIRDTTEELKLSNPGVTITKRIKMSNQKVEEVEEARRVFQRRIPSTSTVL